MNVEIRGKMPPSGAFLGDDCTQAQALSYPQYWQQEALVASPSESEKGRLTDSGKEDSLFVVCTHLLGTQ